MVYSIKLNVKRKNLRIYLIIRGEEPTGTITRRPAGVDAPVRPAGRNELASKTTFYFILVRF